LTTIADCRLLKTGQAFVAEADELDVAHASTPAHVSTGSQIASFHYQLPITTADRFG
jgi:hypothetical protein